MVYALTFKLYCILNLTNIERKTCNSGYLVGDGDSSLPNLVLPIDAQNAINSLQKVIMSFFKSLSSLMIEKSLRTIKSLTNILYFYNFHFLAEIHFSQRGQSNNT